MTSVAPMTVSYPDDHGAVGEGDREHEEILPSQSRCPSYPQGLESEIYQVFVFQLQRLRRVSPVTLYELGQDVDGWAWVRCELVFLLS